MPGRWRLGAEPQMAATRPTKQGRSMLEIGRRTGCRTSSALVARRNVAPLQRLQAQRRECRRKRKRFTSQVVPKYNAKPVTLFVSSSKNAAPRRNRSRYCHVALIYAAPPTTTMARRLAIRMRPIASMYPGYPEESGVRGDIQEGMIVRRRGVHRSDECHIAAQRLSLCFSPTTNTASGNSLRIG
jgi:hypothetical protein